jgi:hypothetical protein
MAATKLRLSGSQVCACIVVSMLTSWLLDRFGRIDLVLPILNSVATMVLLVALKWRLRHYAWFWITMIVVAAIHVPLILMIPWTTKWVPSIAIAAIDTASLFIMIATVSIVGQFMRDRDRRPL